LRLLPLRIIVSSFTTSFCLSWFISSPPALKSKHVFWPRWFTTSTLQHFVDKILKYAKESSSYQGAYLYTEKKKVTNDDTHAQHVKGCLVKCWQQSINGCLPTWCLKKE
jgi:hypothetical protein